MAHTCWQTAQAASATVNLCHHIFPRGTPAPTARTFHAIAVDLRTPPDASASRCSSPPSPRPPWRRREGHFVVVRTAGAWHSLPQPEPRVSPTCFLIHGLYALCASVQCRHTKRGAGSGHGQRQSDSPRRETVEGRVGHSYRYKEQGHQTRQIRTTEPMHGCYRVSRHHAAARSIFRFESRSRRPVPLHILEDQLAISTLRPPRGGENGGSAGKGGEKAMPHAPASTCIYSSRGGEGEVLRGVCSHRYSTPI